VVLSIGNTTRQLEIQQQHGVIPAPTSEDQIVLYLGSIESVNATANRIRQAGREPVRSPNPYWQRNGAMCFIDPDGYWLIRSPSSWT
jgi:hypothetical protein